jgi:hypothetical protein
VSRAVCVKCGASRGDFRAICPSCGYRVEGEGLLVAWLLSDGNLDEAGLDGVAARVRAGEPPRPTTRMLDRARSALGSDLGSDPGLDTPQRIALLVLSLFITPLPALTMAAWWWRDRPRAAVQALALAIPSAAAFGVAVIWAIYASV